MARRTPTTSVRADAKLQNLPQAAHDELWALRHPELETDRAWTLTDVAAWVPDRFQFEVSVSAVGTFYQWLELKRRMDSASATAEQTRLELAANSDLSPEDIERAAQTVFTNEALNAGNIKGYVALAKLRLAANKQALDSQRLAQAAKDKIEIGLDALLAEIQGNPKALLLFNQLKEVVARA